jgi:transglutaminase superfamily protein
MALAAEIRDFYTRQGRMTDAGAMDALLKDAPSDIPGMVAFIQNVLMHMHWAGAYGVQLTPERRDESNLRSLKDMLTSIKRQDDRPLSATRTAEQHGVGVCRHFSVFGVALFRRAGIPARARVGFGAYFNPGTFEDHWVVEYWNGREWQLLDAQIDAVQRSKLHLAFDTLNVPRDQFIIAGDAWQQCRSGRAQAKNFGIFDLRGLWFIAGNVLRDLASLNHEEMLPWDVWGPMIMSDDLLTPDKLALFDKLAGLTLAPDKHFAEVRALYDNDPSLHVPAQVFNVERKRTEAAN